MSIKIIKIGEKESRLKISQLDIIEYFRDDSGDASEIGSAIFVGRILASGFDDSVDGDIKCPLIKWATATGDEVCDAAEDLEPHLQRIIEGRK